jgi:ATP-dependent exoDNAse (exonuclease V) alpha subunit
MPIVKTLNGAKLEVGKESWIIEEDGKIKAEISQLPLRLAWAITVHKSQGMSLDAAEIDLSKSFIKGMGYVALSRVRSLSGLKLLGLNETALLVDEEILEYDETLKELSIDAENDLKELGEDEMKKRQKQFLKEISPTQSEKISKLPTHHKTKVLIEQKLSLKEMAKARKMTEETIISHIEKLLEEAREDDSEMDIEYLKEDALSLKRFEKIQEAFRKLYKKDGSYRLAPVKFALGPSFTYLEVRLARLFIDKEINYE